MTDSFQFAAASLPGLPDAAIPMAATRAGAPGVLDLEFVQVVESAMRSIARLAESAAGRFAVRLDAESTDVTPVVLAELPADFDTVILTAADEQTLTALVEQLRRAKVKVWLQATNVEHARLGRNLGVDAIIAKGHESSGRVGDETTFVLLQRLLKETSIPVWAEGGIGLHTVSACYAAGAAGVILGSQLALVRESRLPEAAKSVIARMDGSETILIGEQLGDPHRIYSRAKLPVIEKLQAIERDLASHTDAAVTSEWRREVRSRIGWNNPEDAVWVLGQDAAFASSLAERFHTVGGIIQGLRQAITDHVEAARNCQPLADGSALATSVGTQYPIAQGPMTRVSDRAPFAAAVAEAGGLPFLALALLRAPELKTLFAQTREQLGRKPWGVGILGFVPLELRQEQLEIIREFRPPFALIAGGRPDQAQTLERDGIPTFLHVPSPNLLKLFLEAGTRRFVFEGRECGGHVGPRTSFVLWELMIDVLLDLPDEDLAECHILFAGGVHDAVSASMIACLGAPLAKRGAKVGVLMGTAYTMTEEAVTTGAIVRGFQEEALRCSGTALLETGPGHATRCAVTDFAGMFAEEKRRLLQENKSPEEIRDTLEAMNLGRLRVATKGVDRNADFGNTPDAPKLIEVEEGEQHSRGMYMIGQVAALRDRACTIAELHHDVSVESTRRVESLVLPTTVAPAPSTGAPVDVAIVGMSCVLPGAPDIETYWENILGKVYSITEVPKSRWDPDLYFDPDRNAPDKTYSKWGGFIDAVEFDPLDYGMPPASIPSVDTLQLLALKAARDAMQDAGYLHRPFDRANTSVILGASGGLGDLGTGYAVRSTLPVVLGEYGHQAVAAAGDRLPDWTEDSFAGLLPNVAAGRISNRLDLGGLNFVVDAACASSLAAVNLAVNELVTGNSSMVLVGGIDTIQSPFGFMCFAKTQALSPNGRPRTFDKNSDGIAIGEGVVMLVLKLLANAERDGDRVYAVIRGTGGSSDGKAMGLTAPRIEGQIQALNRAYERAAFSAATVGLYEAHGTGTAVGDRTEALALGQYLAAAGAAPQCTAVGSVKTMIGHTKATAGVASMAKAALALYHKVLPATLGVTEPNPEARLQDGPLYVNAETRPWLTSPGRGIRRAGVSSFGFGGTNFHAVLEEYTGSDETVATSSRWPSEFFCWTAATRDHLDRQLQALQQAFTDGAEPRLPDLAAMLSRLAQDENAVRLAIVATTLDDLQSKITAAQEQLAQTDIDQFQDPRGIYFSAIAPDAEAKVAFLFPGQGSQSTDMLRDLTIHFAEVREAFERADAELVDHFPQGLSSRIFPPPRFNDEDEQHARQTLSQTNIAQPALGAAGVAMLTLLRSLRITPDMTAGHSYGEYIALHAAGAIDERTLHRLSEARGRSIIESAKDDLGTMAAVSAGPDEVAAALAGIDDVWIANKNSPAQTIISGSNAAIDEAVRRFEDRNLPTSRFPVSCAFHSPLVAPAKDKLADFLSSCTIRSPQVAVFSNTTAARHDDDPAAIVERLSEHLIRPVEFVREIEAMYADGARVFVEVGPGSVLTKLTKRILEGHLHVAVATDAPGRDGLVQLQHCLAQLAVAGVPLSAHRLFEGRVRDQLELESLAETTRPQPPSPTTWLVDGGRARPIVEMPSSQSAEENAIPQIDFSAPNAPGLVTEAKATLTSDAIQPSPPLPAMPMQHPNEEPTQIPATTSPTGDPATAVMQQYQELMERFLVSQQQVMLDYLRSTSDVPQRSPMPALPPEGQAVAPVDHAAPRTVAETHTLTEGPVTAPVDAPSDASATEAPAIVDAAQLTARLLQLVSERTGYPTDMLRLDLDIEAELGIDSIKRVEILATLQSSCLPEGWESGESDMEELLQFRTMQGIVNWMVERAGAAAQTAEPVDSPETSPAATSEVAGMSRGELTSLLLNLVSDRTGYPPEMLDLDLDIEAELGIDSIKRVEILAMLQSSVMPEGWESSESDMEGLLKFRTMRGIIDWMSEQSATVGTAGQVIGQSASPSSQQQPAAEVTELSSDRVTEQLLHLVSDRTGYPTEMLDLDLDIEAELGIDSIKRVEILAMLQSKCLPEGWESGKSDMEELLKFRTMRGIVDWMTDATASRNGAAVNGTSNSHTIEVAAGDSIVEDSEPQSETAAPQSVPRYSYRMVESPPMIRELPKAVHGVVIVTDDETGIADAVIEQLQSKQINAVCVRQADAFSRESSEAYAANMAHPESVTELADQITQDHGSIAGILHLLPLRKAASFDEVDVDEWKMRNAQEVKGLFHLAQATAADLKDAGEAAVAWVIAASRLGGGLGSTIANDVPASMHPGHGGLAGLIKTLALEWPDVHCKLVDLDDATAGDPMLIGALLLDEMAQENRREEYEVGYVNGRRRAPRVVTLPLDARDDSGITIDSDSVILVTGGARGITATVACDLAERYQPTILLAGRSPEPTDEEPAETAALTSPQEIKRALIEQQKRNGEPVTPREIEAAYTRLMNRREMRSNLTRLRELGATVRYYSVDVRDDVDLGGVIDDIYEKHGRIDGVIHGAGVIEDKRIEHKTPESFDRVFETKTRSAFVLSRELRGDSLKFLVFFSSMAGRFGNRGQSDYSAANEVLNKLALVLDRKWPARVVAVNWGPWETGMVSPEVEKQFAGQGVQLIRPADGARVLHDELMKGTKGEVEIVLGDGPWKHLIVDAMPTEQPRVLPLLSAAPRMITGGAIEAVRTLSIQDDRYLLDHELDGKPVLPLAMAMEFAAEVAQHAYPKLTFVGINSMSMLHGIILERERKDIRALARAQTDPSHESLDVSVSVEISEADQPDRPSYRCTVLLSDRFPQPPTLDLMPFENLHSLPLSVEECYERWLFHGPLFAGIRKVHGLNRHGIVADITPSQPDDCLASEPGGRWLVDPVTIDCGFQLGILWERTHYDMTPLPARFDQYRRFDDPGGPAVKTYFVARPEVQGRILNCDIYFFDAAGRMVSIVENLQTACSKELNRLSEPAVTPA